MISKLQGNEVHSEVDLSLIGLNLCVSTNTCLSRGERISEPIKSFCVKLYFKKYFFFVKELRLVAK